uniref:Anaphase-promoting complex subunit 2 isoform X2 n=1 Tax=Rhizophora mucronata TaxID=61149 RepID=A0A2P2KS32_RHIMU
MAAASFLQVQLKYKNYAIFMHLTISIGILFQFQELPCLLLKLHDNCSMYRSHC